MGLNMNYLSRSIGSSFIAARAFDKVFSDVGIRFFSIISDQNSEGSRLNNSARPMKEYFKNERVKFLTPCESNFNNAINVATDLQQRVNQHTTTKSARINFDPRINYRSHVNSFEIPENGKSDESVIEEITDAFKGILRWNSHNVAYNVIPTPLLNTVGVNMVTNLYNPNSILDEISGKMPLYEKVIVKYLCDLAGIDHEKADGVSTFGGKSTLIYAIKLGLNNIDQNSTINGVDQNSYVVTGDTNHYSITSVCNLLGIGKNKCIRSKGVGSGKMDLEQLEINLEKIINKGGKIACIIPSGAETINHAIDDIKEISRIRDKLVKKHNLDYKPHIHMDSVNGWVWLFYSGYDFEKNDLNLNSEILEKIKSNTELMQTVKFADSFSADFHKTGLCPLTSAFFISKDKTKLHSFDSNKLEDYTPDGYGSGMNVKYSIEHSKSSAGITSAYVAVNSLGKSGFQKYLAHLMESGRYIKDYFEANYHDQFEIVNQNSGWHVQVIYPKFNGFPKTWDELCASDDSVKKSYNEICKKFYKFYAFDSKINQSDSPYIGYVQNHWNDGSLTGVSAFKVYPMSPHLDQRSCEELVDGIYNIKKNVEKYEIKSINDFEFDHILR